MELSEYSGKVYFVPYATSVDGQEFHIQIIQDGEALADLPGYVPEALSGEPFQSLDAVSFFDVNYDGGTDIVLIETYGDKSFAAVCYGYADDAAEYDRFFRSEEALSENITRQAETLTIPGIREFLASGKKNGEFSGYQEAYDAVSRLRNLELEEDRTYNMTYSLLYVDEDEIPELAAGVDGYYVSLYTYHDGKVFTLMDRWPYGAMGNAGYEYAPRKNNLRNYNADYAGAIMYTTYMSINDRHTLEITAEIKTVNFDDVNENGVPDEDEMGSFGRYGVNYIDGRTVSIEECASYDAGDYEMICGSMSLEDLQAALKK